MEEIKKKLVDIFKLEERVLYDAAGAADIVAAAEAEAQAQQQAADQAAEEARQAAEEAAKNAPPEDPSAKNEAEAGNAADIEAADDIDVDSIVDGAFADVDDADDMDFGADDITADAVVDDMRADDESETLYAEAFKVEAEEVRELVVINSSVKDAQKIIDSLGENTDVLILENGKDGLDQINDYLDEKEGTLVYGYATPDGSAVKTETASVRLVANNSAPVAHLCAEGLPENAVPFAELSIVGEETARRKFVEKPYHQLGLTPCEIKVTNNGDGTATYLADHLVLGVCLDLDGEDKELSDNFFDLYPGRPYTVKLGRQNGEILYSYMGQGYQKQS